MKLEDLHYDVPAAPVNAREFDLEKWRKEYPIDYFKAFWLVLNLPKLNVSSDVQFLLQNESFKAVYRVIRMYIPQTLYKYYSLTDDAELNNQKLETLKKNKIFMSPINKFNDPFDSKAFFYNPEALKKFEDLKHCNGRLIDDFSSYNIATSLTANGVQSMPMWAHYANNHAGYCVSYSMKENDKLSSCTFPIQYTDERLDITSLMEKQVEMLLREKDRQLLAGSNCIHIKDLSIVFAIALLGNIKQKSWDYEKEFRCSEGAIAPGAPYMPAKPKEIYIGKNCSTEHKKQLKDIAKELKIPIFQMCFNELSESYELSTQKL